MDTNSRMQIADKAMKSFIARYFRDDEDGTGMITGEFYWPRAEIMEVVMDAWDKTKDPYYQESAWYSTGLEIRQVDIVHARVQIPSFP